MGQFFTVPWDFRIYWEMKLGQFLPVIAGWGWVSRDGEEEPEKLYFEVKHVVLHCWMRPRVLSQVLSASPRRNSGRRRTWNPNQQMHSEYVFTCKKRGLERHCPQGCQVAPTIDPSNVPVVQQNHHSRIKPCQTWRGCTTPGTIMDVDGMAPWMTMFQTPNRWLSTFMIIPESVYLVQQFVGSVLCQ